MNYLKRSRFLRYVVLPLTLLALLPGCYKWTMVETGVDLPTELPRSVRVTLTDGESLVLENVTITTDSLFGQRGGNKRESTSEERDVRLPLDDVRWVERRSDPGNSTAIALLPVALLISFLTCDICKL